jgi:hypothetical protein
MLSGISDITPNKILTFLPPHFVRGSLLRSKLPLILSLLKDEGVGGDKLNQKEKLLFDLRRKEV